MQPLQLLSVRSVNNINGKYHGKYVEWNDNGNIVKYCFYKNGILHGEYREIIYNGDERYKIICNYLNGKLHGTCNEWVNEQLIRKQTFHNGILHGEYINFKLCSEGYYKPCCIYTYCNGVRLL